MVGKKKPPSALKSSPLFRGTIRRLAETVSIPKDLIDWIFSPAGRPSLVRAFDQVCADWLIDQPWSGDPVFDLACPWLYLPKGTALPAGRSIVRVKYSPPPTFDELQSVFRVVTGAYDGRDWTPDPSCAGIGREPGDRLFWDADPPKEVGASKESLIAWADSKRPSIAPFGWRPAIHLEMCAYLSVTPICESPMRWRLALGDSTRFDTGQDFAAFLPEGGGGCLMHVHWREEREAWAFDNLRYILVAKRPGEVHAGVRIAA